MARGQICEMDREESTYSGGAGDLTGEGRIESVTRFYTLTGYATRYQAEQALYTSPLCPINDPNYSGTLVRDQVSVTAVNPNSSGNQLTIYTGQAVWRRWIPDVIGDEKITGNISTQSINITFPSKTLNSYAPAGETAEPHPGGINTTDQAINGLDIGAPLLQFTIRKTYPRGTVANLNTLVTIHDFVERPNSTLWRGFGVANVKLIGADVSDLDDNEDVINYTFQASPTITFSIVGAWGTIGPITKRGFDYVWTINKKKPHPTTGWNLPAPHTAFVEQPVDLVDLSSIPL